MSVLPLARWRRFGTRCPVWICDGRPRTFATRAQPNRPKRPEERDPRQRGWFAAYPVLIGDGCFEASGAQSGHVAVARVRVRVSTSQHLLDRLAGDSELAGDVSLGHSVLDQSLHEVSPFGGELAREHGVLDRLGSNFADAVERRLVGCVDRHTNSMTTLGCHVNQGLSPSRRDVRLDGGSLAALGSRQHYAWLGLALQRSSAQVAALAGADLDAAILCQRCVSGGAHQMPRVSWAP